MAATDPSLPAETADVLPELLFGRARARLFAVLFVLSDREFYFR